VIVPRIIIGAAVVLAFLVARRERAHLPVAVALGAALAGDCVRAAWAGPPAVELAIYLLAPALSAWCAVRVLAGEGNLSAARPALALLAGALWIAREHPEGGRLFAHAAALVFQGAAAALFWRSDRPTRTPELCALVLAAGDVLALVGPLGWPAPWEALGWGWAVTAAQAGVIGAVLVVLQLRALMRGEDGRESS
jgi:hypothetical protein